MSDLAHEFPSYPVTSLPPIPVGWEPTHWYKNACPSWQVADRFAVYIDWPDPADREVKSWTRFGVVALDPDGALDEDGPRLDSDDWMEVLMWLAQHVGSPRYLEA